ncbi:sporulation phosphorelay system protein KapB [Staphylococcus epidermidis]
MEEVIKHGKEGDLDDPNEREGVFFDEGKGLRHFEKG